MPRMTGGEAIVDSLLRHGIDTVFGLPGVQTYGLFDAFALAQPPASDQCAARTDHGLHGAGLCLCDRATRRLCRRARARRAQHHRGTGDGLGRQRAGAVPHRPGAERDDRPRPRSTARAAGSARDVAQPAEVGRAHRHPSQASYLVARAFQEMLSGRRGPGGARDAMGPVRRDGRDHAAGAVAASCPIRCRTRTGSTRWRSC